MNTQDEITRIIGAKAQVQTLLDELVNGAPDKVEIARTALQGFSPELLSIMRVASAQDRTHDIVKDLKKQFDALLSGSQTCPQIAKMWGRLGWIIAVCISFPIIVGVVIALIVWAGKTMGV